MQTYEVTVTNNGWTLIAENEDYFMQNIGNGKVRVKAGDVVPADDLGAFVMDNGDVLSQILVTGTVWAKADTSTDVAVSVTK